VPLGIQPGTFGSVCSAPASRVQPTAAWRKRLPLAWRRPEASVYDRRRPPATVRHRKNDVHHNLDTASPSRRAAENGLCLVGHRPWPYPGNVTELPIDDAAGLASAAHDAAERGQVVYLTDPQGRRIAAIVPASVAAAGSAAIEALEDAADVAVAQEALAEWDADDRRTYRLADVDAELSES
jgi:hypothetical protein